ncbi:Laminin subunit gamma-1 [Sergentomyia squamirostris]
MNPTLCAILLMLMLEFVTGNSESTHYMPPLECVDLYRRPQRCIPEFENAAYDLRIDATNTCGEEKDTDFCVQTGYSNKKSCDVCRAGDHTSRFLTDIHDPTQPTWWQSETMFEGVQYPSQVNLTLNLGKSFDITYIRIVFYSPRPESFSIYKRIVPNGPWLPYQHYSGTCRDTYSLPDSLSVKKGEDESRALCNSDYSDISPLRDGTVVFSSLEGRPSAINFENSIELHNWVTATDIRITLDRLNTFGDEVFGDAHVLKSYFYAIADIAVGARCKCNGHASKCVTSTGLNGQRTRVCECKHNTDGPDCERCLPYYNDVPWARATPKNAHECKECNCNGFSQKCFFDRHLYNLTGHGGHCLDCTANRDGANCERCKENFYMDNKGYCINCECDSVGSRTLQCNAEGRCQCKPGVTGDKCDRCEANYYNFGPHGCQHCGCEPKGSLDNTPSCDPVTGACMCKENVEGRRCKECKPGFFNLDSENKFGCTPCFCYGQTSECQSASGYSIVSLTSNFNKHLERWLAIDDHSALIDLKYNKFSQSVGITAQGNDFIYFSAPERFLGDQRASYNRLLKFRLQTIGQSGPNPSPNDVILEGAGTSISLPIFAQGHYMPDQQVREYAFRLHEHPEYSWQPSQSARGFMSILSNLTAIKIRASYAAHGEAYLDDVELQTAHRGAAGRPATWIEQCTCPKAYLGQFCESCAPGYRHSPANGGPFMPCIPCDCNKHAQICDSETGRCICQHNTGGDTCDQCAKGYYGNALVGTPYDCKRCPCPDNGACMQMADDSVICLECPVGYFGPRCESCSDGFFGDPTGLHGEVRFCQACDCNGNVDPNAVGNCNRTTGECLKCIHNTAGSHCDQCLPGHFGDPLALPHGNCQQCSCYPAGTEETEDGVSMCDSLTGNCRCKPYVVGRNCNECQNGYFNIISGHGCESCNCDPVGSYSAGHNSTCDRFTGQCRCKPGVVGLKCDQCAPYHYGFSEEGCLPCNCDQSGSKSSQCDESGQCPCNDNVEGRRCDRCKENKYDRHQGCLNCPACYNLVQDATNKHREKLGELKKLLDEIASKPTVIDDDEFSYKLKHVQEKIDILAEDAKAGAGGGEHTLRERLNDFRDRLAAIWKLLSAAENVRGELNKEASVTSNDFKKTEATIAQARDHLASALELLQTEGAQALARAKDRSDQFGSQSEQISAISREARARADELEAKANFNRDVAVQASGNATEAYNLARDSMALLQNISNELKTNVKAEVYFSKDTVDTAINRTADILKEADEVYEEALSLVATVNAQSTPDVNIEKIKKQANKNNEEARKMEEKLNEIRAVNEKLLNELNENNDKARNLIEMADDQRFYALGLLEEAKHSNEMAKEAVAQGDGTLKEANHTYNTLAAFQSEVDTSSANAKAALLTVPGIEKEIRDAERMVDEAEAALSGAYANANAARENAQKAKEKYAEQASKDAEEILKKANDTKFEARKLRGEADQLNGRVAVTDNRINNLEELAKKDDDITNEAKKSVGQAKTNAEEAQKQVQGAMDRVKSIMDELNNLKDINVADLDALEKRLEDAENDLREANLSKRMETLMEYKNYHNQMIKEYQTQVNFLETEVTNIRAIAEALPAGCFKRTRLEP